MPRPSRTARSAERTSTPTLAFAVMGAGGDGGRTVLVTGMASGIGRAVALAFAAEGATVCGSDIDPAGAELASSIERQGGRLHFERADLAEGRQIADAFGRMLGQVGRLDVAVNAAGVGGPRGPVDEISIEDWERTLAVNLTGVWLCMREEVRAMRRSGGGSIINVASVGGLTGYAGAAAYVASKHGLIGLTRTAAVELAGSGIRVNAVCPGAVRTPLLEKYVGGEDAISAIASARPLGRLVTVEEVAAAVLWLASDAAGSVVGESLVLDGGLLAGR